VKAKIMTMTVPEELKLWLSVYRQPASGIEQANGNFLNNTLCYLPEVLGRLRYLSPQCGGVFDGAIDYFAAAEQNSPYFLRCHVADVFGEAALDLAGPSEAERTRKMLQELEKGNYSALDTVLVKIYKEVHVPDNTEVQRSTMNITVSSQSYAELAMITFPHTAAAVARFRQRLSLIAQTSRGVPMFFSTVAADELDLIEMFAKMEKVGEFPGRTRRSYEDVNRSGEVSVSGLLQALLALEVHMAEASKLAISVSLQPQHPELVPSNA
jgi:hypothetical protein